jgi:hypothetical protein
VFKLSKDSDTVGAQAGAIQKDLNICLKMNLQCTLQAPALVPLRKVIWRSLRHLSLGLQTVEQNSKKTYSSLWLWLQLYQEKRCGFLQRSLIHVALFTNSFYSVSESEPKPRSKNCSC